jgi:hypothetical protein
VLAFSATTYAVTKPADRSADGAVAATELVTHEFLSGAIRVAATGERLDVHISRDGCEHSEFNLAIIMDSGKVVASKDAIVGPDKTVTLSYDPGTSSLLRARISFVDDVGFLCDGCIPSIELVSVTDKGARTKVFIGDFHHAHVEAP